MSNLKTLKDLEFPDNAMPRIMTPENGKEYDYSKGEPKILDEKYTLHVYSEMLRQAAREWLAEYERLDVIAKKKLNASVNWGAILFIRHFFNLESDDSNKKE